MLIFISKGHCNFQTALEKLVLCSEWQIIWPLSAGQRAENKWLRSPQDLNDHYITPTPAPTSQDSENAMEEEAGCKYGWGGLLLSLSPGFGRTVALMSSGHCRCLYQPCTRSSQSKFQHVWQRDTCSSSPFWGAMGSSWVLEEGESFFFKGVAPSRLPMLQSMAPQQCSYEHQLDLMNAFFF